MHFLIHFLSFPWITAEKRRGNTEMTRKVETGWKKLIKGSYETARAVVPKYHEKQYNRSGNTVLNAYPRGYALKAAFPGISGETIDKEE